MWQHVLRYRVAVFVIILRVFTLTAGIAKALVHVKKHCLVSRIVDHLLEEVFLFYILNTPINIGEEHDELIKG